MFDSPIKDILTQRVQALPEMVMAQSLKSDIDELVARILPQGSVAVIDDARTSTAYGDLVFRALKGRYDTTHIMLPLGVKADDMALAEVAMRSSKADLLVAVGSGTISDLAKYASFKAGKPYVIFPTAASMNGYTSKNASISIGGQKTSLAAQLPAAMFIDMSTILEAPIRLTQAGLGDSIARPTAQADMLLSHHLLGTAYDEDIFRLNAPYEELLFAHAAGLLSGDRETMEALVKLILLSGFGMTIADSSAPASGAEHMIAHLMESEMLHGEEIAVTAVDMARRQERMLASPKLRLADLPAAEDKGYMKKRDAIRERFPDGDVPKVIWEQAREAIAQIHMPSGELEKIRAAGGLPDMPEKLGWEVKEYHEAIEKARFTRDRFTVLDVTP